MLSLTLLGCGTIQPEVVLGPPRAIVEVTNRTPSETTISLNGWWLGTVAAGQRAQFREIRPGTHIINARFANLGDQQSSVDCTGGQVCGWTLVPGANEGDALPIPPKLGSLRITNPFPETVHLRVVDHEERQLLPGTTIHLRDLSAGDHVLRIHVPGSNTTQAMTVPVVGDQEDAVTLQLPTGTVEIVNNTGELVRVLVDGTEETNVGDQQTQTLRPLLAGVRRLTAVGTNTGRVHRRTVHLSDTTPTQLSWDLSAKLGTLIVRNQSAHNVQLSMNGQPLMALPARQEHTIENLALGIHSFKAEGPDASEWQATLSIATGHQTRWTLRADRGTLWITNHLAEPVEVHLGKATLAVIQPGASVTLDAIAAGSQTINVFGLVSHHIQQRTLAIGPHNNARWEVTQPTARFHVRNTIPEEVLVYIDRQPIGRVSSQKEIIFTQVAPGRRVVEAVGTLSGKTVNATLDILPSQTTRWNVATTVGVVSVINHTDEVLVAPPGLRHQGESIAPNMEVDYVIAAGNRLLHFVGRSSDQSYQHRLVLREGQKALWDVQPLEGTVQVFNRTSAAQEIRIDKVAVTTVAPGKTHAIRLRSGPHHMVAVSTDSSLAIMATLMVRPEVTSSWVLKAAQATLRIVNHTAEIVDLRFNDATLGYVIDGSERIFGPFSPGEHKVMALGRWSGAVYETTTQLVDGRTEVWEVHPAQGTIVVHNRRSESIRIVLNGTTIQSLDAQQSGRISVPLGKHTLELIGVQTHEVFRQRLRIKPNRTYAAVAPAGPAQLHVTNALPVALTIQINGATLGTVAAQSEQTFPFREFGWIDVLATGPDTTLSWYRRFLVNDDRELRWQIDP